MKLRTSYRLLLNAIFMATILLLTSLVQAAPLYQTTSDSQAQRLLERLTPEERIGQLFLVTFEGPEAASASATGVKIYNLIVSHHIGGVILSAANNNFLGYDLTLPVAHSLITQLQRNEYSASQEAQLNPVTLESFTPAYIPLLIGITQEGNGYPYDQILNGLTPLPSQMSLGATWNPDLAHEVGMILGNELSTLGFNLLIGPSLDVLEPPYSESGGDLGVRTFGGDPYWVGEMGKAYISGVHEGSNNNIAVVAKHFPGFGGSDRLPEDEVATVRKSLEQLKQIELAPFFAVTGDSSSPETTADALLTAHIRYQGFQGNIRATTKPVSFDPQAFSSLIDLPEFSNWRENGGIFISDNLGSRAVRRFYDPTGQTFNGQFVARDAFLAGNDLLYLGNFVSSGDEDSYTTIERTLNFFAQKYREDAAFAQRVDQSVLKILTLKYKLYNESFTLNNATTPESGIQQLGSSDQTTFRVAQEAATLISPAQEELDDALPASPGRNEKIVFITDSRIYQSCSLCRQEFTMTVTDFSSAVLKFYRNLGQVLPGNFTNYSFEDLQELIVAGVGVLQIENDLRNADWIVVSMSNVTPNITESLAFRNFLNERPDLYQGKKLVVFAFDAPYFLDATEISKLTAYYGLYSKRANFIDVAARLLFKELIPSGNLPISVPAVGYDLNTITFPDPDQVIQISLDTPNNAIENSNGTTTPEAEPLITNYQIGDVIPIRTGVIQDHNGHHVPDGTIVKFIISQNGEGLTINQFEAQTMQGIARSTIRIDRSGTMEIRAESEPAKNSTVLRIDIIPENVTPNAVTITSTASETPSPTITPTPTPVPTREVITTPIPTLPETISISDWFFSLITAGVVGGANLWLASGQGYIRWGIRAAFLSIIGGLLSYIYLAVNMPGSQSILQGSGLGGIILLTLLGAGVGSGVIWLWYVLYRHG
jgi:beta-N-acetylhexosaminidase